MFLQPVLNPDNNNGCCGVCRVPSTLRPLLSTASAPKDELYSEEQMREVLSAYTATNALEVSDGSIKLDKLMISNLFNKKEPQMEEDSCPVEEVVRRLLGKLQLFHKVTRVTEQVRLVQRLLDVLAMQRLFAQTTGRAPWSGLFLKLRSNDGCHGRLLAAEDRNVIMNAANQPYLDFVCSACLPRFCFLVLQMD